jgi:4-hydroxybenzoate polyprenyltransferase
MISPDREIDPHVKRTKERPIASGKVSEKEALILFFILMSLAFLLIFFLNRQTQILALIGACITAIYPFVKRILSAPQLILGLAIGWGVPMAFAAQTGTVPLLGW